MPAPCRRHRTRIVRAPAISASTGSLPAASRTAGPTLSAGSCAGPSRAERAPRPRPLWTRSVGPAPVAAASPPPGRSADPSGPTRRRERRARPRRWRWPSRRDRCSRSGGWGRTSRRWTTPTRVAGPGRAASRRRRRCRRAICTSSWRPTAGPPRSVSRRRADRCGRPSRTQGSGQTVRVFWTQFNGVWTGTPAGPPRPARAR
jgi:hypothetical protein